jgi:hypothetical protein
MITFLAPAWMCLEAVAVSTNRPVDEDRAVLGTDLGRQVAVDGVVLEQVGQRLGVGQIVDGDDLDVLRFQRGAEEHATDAPEAVDTNSNAHGRAPCEASGISQPKLS